MTNLREITVGEAGERVDSVWQRSTWSSTR